MKSNTRRLTFMIPNLLYKNLEKQAKKEYRTISEVLRNLVVNYLNEKDKL